MKIFTSLRFLAAVSLAFISTVAGWSQAADGPVGVAVNIKALDLDWDSSSGYVELDIDGLNGNESALALHSSGVSPQFTTRLEPGKTYFLNVESVNLGDMTIQAVPPPGYVMEIERVPRERLHLGYGDPTSIRLRVVAPFQEYTGRGGTATMLASGRVLWQASLGSLANGASAGALSIIDAGASGLDLVDLFSPAGLLYEHTSSEVEVIYRSPSHPDFPNTIQQILAPQVCVEVYLSTTAPAEFKFYHRGQMKTTPSSGVREFNGDPFAWYSIDQQEDNKISIRCDLRENESYTATGDPDQTKYTVLERTGTAPNYTWKADDWYEGSASVSRDTRARSSGVESITVAVPGGATAFSGSRTYSSVPWGEEITSETGGTSNTVTTGYSFYTSSDQTGSYGRLQAITTTGGGWEAYEYYDFGSGSSTADLAGALHKRHRPFKNSSTSVPGTISSHTAGAVTTYEYAADVFGRKTRPSLVETAVDGVVTQSASTTYSDASASFTGHSSLYLVTATRSDSSATSTALTTIIKYFREDAGATSGTATDDFFRMQTHSTQRPDGTKQSFVYQRGTWGGGSSFTLSANAGTDYGPASRISIINGIYASSPNFTTYGSYDIDDLSLVEDKSTMEVTIRDEFARIRRTETHVWHSSAWELLTYTDYDYNLANQLTSRVSTPGGQYEAAWLGEHQLWEKDETGVKVSFTDYDDAGRVEKTVRDSGGSGAIAALSTWFTYNAAHQLTEMRSGVGFTSGENLITARTYDDAGRPATETPPGLGTTTYSYNPSSRTRTISAPESVARTETWYADGQIASVTGSGVVESHYDHQILSGGVRYSLARLGSSSSTRTRESWSDWLGRQTKASRPGWASLGAFEEVNTFDSSGRLEKTTTTGYSQTLYEYNAMGQLTRAGLDVGNGNSLVLNSSDRITDSDQSFEYASSAWWLKSETKTYPYSSGTAVTTSVARTRLTGHASGQLAETQVTDAEGNVTTSSVTVDRANKTVTVTTARSGLNNETATIVNGFTTSATGVDGLTFTTQYDALLRVSSVTDPRIGATTTTYHSGSTLPATVTPAAGLLYSCSYDGLGRKTLHTDAAGKKTRYGYNTRGQLVHQWGDGAYPVQYGYDSTYGDRTSQSTYRSAPAADSTGWPSVGTADTTGFEYDTPTGFLKKKTDAATKFTEFTYNNRGQTYERFWSRTYGGNRVKATYGYDGNTGELTGITYNDGTPSVAYTYTRLGQVASATDATGARSFTYDSSKPWRLTSTTLPSFYGSRVQTELYESSGRVGRARGFQLGSSVGSTADLEQAYSFTSGGRFETLATKRASNAVSRTFRYAYRSSSDLVETLSIDGSHPFTVTRDYDSNRDLLKSIDSKWSGTSRTRYDYTSNSLYQRESSKQSGNVFADYGDATFTRYTYNARGELTDAPAYLGSTVSDLSKPLPGRQQAYDYDSIGNRKSTNRTGNSSLKESYFAASSGSTEGANPLNQYVRRENDSLPVQGTVDSVNTIVAVGGVTGGTVATSRQGRYWAAEAVLDNSGGPKAGTLTVQAAKVGGGGGGTDLVHTDPRAAWIPSAVQTLEYDLDGNLTGDGVWTYTWDAENRLIRMETTSAATTGGLTARVLEFRYDYAGRRVQKRSYTSSAETYTRYLYDGWNLEAEFNAPSGTSCGSLLRSYTWGLDLVGSLSASGGVGALLQIHDYAGSGNTLLPTYDGNGNVSALLNADTGAVEAAYEYDSFGNLLRTEGTYAKSNPFRFSSKFTDDETGLIYYGHRYYAPSMGRFLNRDPIEESGGLNLYGYCGNDGVNNWDYLGMVVSGDHPFAFWIYFPFDFDDGPIGGGSFGPRTRIPGTMSPMGPLARLDRNHVAVRGRSPYDSRRLVYAAFGGGPDSVLYERGVPRNSGPYFTASRGAGTMDFLSRSAIDFMTLLAHAGANDPASARYDLEGHARIDEAGESMKQSARDFATELYGVPDADYDRAIGDGEAEILSLLPGVVGVIENIAMRASSTGLKGVKHPVPPLRQKYIDAVNGLAAKVRDLRKAGKSSEEIARLLHAERRALGVKYKAMTPPDKLAEITAQNIKDYGDPLGPTIDWLRAHGKSWDDIIESASRSGNRIKF